VKSCRHRTMFVLYGVAAEEPVAMDTDNVGSTVTEGTSSLSSQQPVTSPVAMAACSLPDSSIGLLASMPKVSLDEVALDLAEPFSLGTYYTSTLLTPADLLHVMECSVTNYCQYIPVLILLMSSNIFLISQLIKQFWNFKMQFISSLWISV